MYGCVIKLGIEDGPPPVFYRVFDCCDEEDNDQGNGIEAGIRGTEDGEYLRQRISSNSATMPRAVLTLRMMMKRK